MSPKQRFSDFLASQFDGKTVRYDGCHRLQDTRWHCTLRGVPPVSDQELAALVATHWEKQGRMVFTVLPGGHYGVFDDKRLLSLTITNYSSTMGLILLAEEELPEEAD